MEIDCGTDVEIQGIDSVTVFDSSAWAERGFCSRCGSHLFYRIKETGQHMVPVGLFDIDTELEFEMQVFVDERPDYYRFANQTEELTGAELFAKFAPPD